MGQRRKNRPIVSAESGTVPKHLLFRKKWVAAVLSALALLLIAGAALGIYIAAHVHGAPDADPDWSKTHVSTDSVKEIDRFCGSMDLLYSKLDYDHAAAVSFVLDFDEGCRNDPSRYNTLDCYLRFDADACGDRLELQIVFPNSRSTSEPSLYKTDGTSVVQNGILVEYSDLSGEGGFHFGGCARFESGGNIYYVEASSERREDVLFHYLELLTG